MRRLDSHETNFVFPSEFDLTKVICTKPHPELVLNDEHYVYQNIKDYDSNHVILFGGPKCSIDDNSVNEDKWINEET